MLFLCLLSRLSTEITGELATKYWQAAQGYNVLSFFYANLLLYGIAPVEAVGFTSILFLVWYIDLVLIKKALETFPVKWLKWMPLLAISVLSAIAAGTLT